jgi:hypothetical protein
MSRVDRRLLLLGGAAALSGCVSPSPEDCDPARGGLIRGLGCMSNGGYHEHLRGYQVANEGARNHLGSVQGETARLEMQLAALRDESAALRSQLLGQEQERLRLQARLIAAATDRAAADGFMNDFYRWAEAVKNVHDQVLALKPPPQAVLPFSPTTPAQLSEQQRKLNEAIAIKRQELAREQDLTDHRLKEVKRIGVITVGVLGGKAAGEKFMGIMLRRAGLTAVDPAIGVIVMIVELSELAWEVYKAYHDDKEFREGRRP